MISIIESSEHCTVIQAGGPAPRGAAPVRSTNNTTPVGNLSDSREGHDSDDEDRQRMRVNVFATVAVIVLISIGVWLTNAMMDTEKAQGCYVSGEHTCSMI